MIKRIKDILHKISNKQIYLISFIVALIDQITKSLIIHNLILAKETVIIPNFFSLIYVTNTGAAFSSLPNKTSLLIIMSLFCLALIMTIIQKEKRQLLIYLHVHYAIRNFILTQKFYFGLRQERVLLL